MSDTTVRIILTGQSSGLSAANASAEASLKKLEGQAARTQSATNNLTASQRQLQQQMRQVEPQITDIVTSLYSGQAPLTVLIQQGGQLRDMFGGIAPAGRALASVLTLANVAFFAAAAGAGTLVAALYAGHKQSEAFSNAMSLTGRAAGITEGQFNSLIESVAKAGNTTVGSARDIAQALVASGRVGGAALESMAIAAARVAEVSGKSTEDVTGDFVGMANGVTEWAITHNKSWNFATAGQIDYIRQLEKTGQKQQAMIEVSNLVTKANENQITNLGYLERAWNGMGRAISGALDLMQSWGRKDTFEEKMSAYRDSLTAAQRGLDEANRTGQTDRVKSEWQAAVNAANRRVRDLEIEIADGNKRAGNRGVFAREQQAVIEQRAADLKRPAGAKGDPEREYQQMVKSVLANRATSLSSIEHAGYEAATRAAADNMAKSAQEAQRRNDQALDFGLQLQDQTAQLNAGLIKDDRERGNTLIELDRALMQARLDELAAYGTDVTAAQDALNANIVARTAQLNEQLKPQWLKMIEGFQDTTAVIQRGWDNMGTYLVQSGENAFAQWASGAEVSGKKVAQGLLAELARMQYQQFIGSATSGGSGGFVNMLASFFGGGSGNPSSSSFVGPPAYAKGGAFPGGTGLHAFANTVVTRPTTFAFAKGQGLMGEAGPEAIMPLKRDSSGRLGVVSAGGAGGMQLSFPTTINIDSRSDAGQIAQMVAGAMAQTEKRVYRTLKDRGIA